MRIEALDHVALYVRDRARSAAWYREALGLERQHEDVWGDYPVVMGSGATGVALFPAGVDGAGAPAPARAPGRFAHVAFRVSGRGLVEAAAALRARGVPFEEQDHQIARSLYVHDPDGHQVELTTYEVGPAPAARQGDAAGQAPPRMQERISESVLGSIGGTPLVPLRRIGRREHARVVLKMEGANPTGSMKDRMAQAAIEAAERDGRLRPGGTVVEYTGGSTGVALALVCAAKGYRCRLVSSDAFSREKLDHMAALGAEVTVIPSENGRITQALIKAMIAKAAEYAKEPGAFWTDQLNNRDIHRGYHALGEELWAQAGRVDAFVHSVGTAHSIAGVAEALRKHSAEVRIVAVEPAESPILSEGRSGGHRIEGIGIGFVPPLWDPRLPDKIVSVSSDEAYAMARRLAREEALFAGPSTGANVVAALALAQELPPDATVATLMVDTGLKYLSTELYRRDGA